MSPLGGNDPRREPGAARAPLASEDDGPVVGRTVRPTNILVIVGAFALLAITLFLFLESRRAQQTASLVTPIATPSATPAPAPALDIPRPVVTPPPAVVTAVAPAPVAIAAPPLPAAPLVDPTVALHAPAVVVDLQSPTGRGGSVLGAAGGSGVAGANAPGAKPVGVGGAPGAAGDVVANGAAGSVPNTVGAAGSTEQFAAHASETIPEPAVATQLTNLGTTITQGATIPGILETALNSDLPGYTRAVVSRDVRAFDGKAVLIPRGSRLIGQYRNALSLGQSRVFVIWTRVIRPDGVSIQIGSPGGDALGRGGLTGDVNSHFFARFGGAILLSVLSTGTAAVAGTPSTQVTIGSPAAAAGAAASATIPTGSDIPPTITVMQGEAITIFVARDLDFTGVKPVP